jgi:hypothetical protein
MYKPCDGNGYTSDIVTYLAKLLLNAASNITPTHETVRQQKKWKMLHRNYLWIIILYYVFKVKHMTFEKVNSFVHLATLITTDNNTSAEINNRITLANRSYFGLVNILKAKNINRKYKVIIYTLYMYKTLIKPVLMYGAETWVLSKADMLRYAVEFLREKY